MEWETPRLHHKTMPDTLWEAEAGRVQISVGGECHDRPHWLIVARNKATGEVKCFIGNAPPRTGLNRMLEAAFSRWGIEHLFRVAKSEIGPGHYDGRRYRGLMRHMILCQLTLLFVAEQTERLGGKKPHVTKEQVARVLNRICRGWLTRQRGGNDPAHTAEMIAHHQTRNAAAERSRGKPGARLARWC